MDVEDNRWILATKLVKQRISVILNSILYIIILGIGWACGHTKKCKPKINTIISIASMCLQSID
jgi:hypothetical protein